MIKSALILGIILMTIQGIDGQRRHQHQHRNRYHGGQSNANANINIVC